jgi:preprotein translocase subunit YajC
MNIEFGDYVETIEGYVWCVVSVDTDYICVATQLNGDIWIHRNKIVRVCDEYRDIQ